MNQSLFGPLIIPYQNVNPLVFPTRLYPGTHLDFFITGTPLQQPIASLDARVSLLRSQVYAESTKRTYSSYLSSYKHFCFQNGIPLVPISQQNLGRYIAHLTFRCKYSSITNDLSIIRILHLESGFINPLESYYVSTLKKGTRRFLGDSVNRKLPITPTILLGIFSQLSLKLPLHVTFWAACLVAFFSFFRKSNLFMHSQSQKTKFLCRSHVSFSPSGAVISVDWSKTIQYSQRVLSIPLPFIKNSPMCPSTSLYLTQNLVPGARPNSSPFQYPLGSTVQVLTYSKFLLLLQDFLRGLHIDPKSYSGHSFRRGGASFALECGVPAELIQSQGDWRSNAYQAYLDPSFKSRQQVSNVLSAAIIKNYS